jgi:hypothetical protein
LNSTATTKSLWRDLVEVHKVQMGLVPHNVSKHGHIIPPEQSIKHMHQNIDWGNEQGTFNAIVKHSQSISLAWLPSGEFKPGVWIRDGLFNVQVESKTLKMIHANFHIGMASKVNALKSHHLWFVREPQAVKEQISAQCRAITKEHPLYERFSAV